MTGKFKFYIFTEKGLEDELDGGSLCELLVRTLRDSVMAAELLDIDKNRLSKAMEEINNDRKSSGRPEISERQFNVIVKDCVGRGYITPFHGRIVNEASG